MATLRRPATRDRRPRSPGERRGAILSGGRAHGDAADGQAAPSNAFQMRQQMLAVGDDFWVENGAGERAYRVDGKALRVAQTLVIETADGRELFRIRERLLHVRDTMEIEGPSGSVATVKKALISPLRERYTVELAAGGEWAVQGDIVDHEYEISGPGGRIAEVAKRWSRVRDTYGVEVAPGQDAALAIAVTVVVDRLAHPGR